MTTTVGRLRDSVRKPPNSLLFQWLLAAAFLIPFLASIGQFAHTGFLGITHPFPILFWPKAAWKLVLPLPVWLTMGLMGLSYLAGIFSLAHNRTLGNVVLWTIAALIAASVLGFAVNSVTGWKELQDIHSMELAGKANGLIFSSWQNPLWEEVVFRGLPLLVAVILRNKNKTMPAWVRWAYVILPNIVFAIYHVPRHGPSRLADTFVLGCAFSWMALRYSFFAPLIMHYVLDAMLVMSLIKIPNIPAEEISWLVQNGGWINSSWSLAVLGAMGAFVVTSLWNALHVKKEAAAT